MSKSRERLVILAMLLVGALVGVMLMGGDPSENKAGSRTFPESVGPELGNEHLTAHISLLNEGGRNGTQVRLTGSMHKVELNEVVLRSQESPEMLRLGWESADHLVISLPQYAQDAGRAPGDGDASFACGSKSTAVRVSCQTYPVGVR